MDLATVLARLDLTAHAPAISRGWEESVQCRSPGEIFFLEETFVRTGCEYLKLPVDVQELAVDTANRIRVEPSLVALIWHAHCRLYRDGPGIGNWPPLTALLGGASGMFYFLALLSNHPNTRAFHEAHAVPAPVVIDTLSAVFHFLKIQQKRSGHYGLTPLDCSAWLTNHLRGEIYQLGRLQFIYKPFPTGCVVFRHRTSRQVIALAEAGQVFRHDGQFNGASGLTESAGIWTSDWQEGSDFVMGNPVDPVPGSASAKPVRLARADWTEVLRPGDPVLDIHIPATGPMPAQDCADSVRRAVDFFQKHFPEKPPARALICTSWILDAQLASYLNPNANLRLFQQQFYLYPADCDAWSIVRFIFDLDIPYGQVSGVNLTALPQKTALEKAVVAHIAAGGHWRKAGGFRLIEDLPWGSAVYSPPPGLFPRWP